MDMTLGVPKRTRTDVFFLELSRQMALHKRSLSHAAIADEDELKFWNVLSRLGGKRGKRIAVGRQQQLKQPTSD
jgi:hypothetical protein